MKHLGSQKVSVALIVLLVIFTCITNSHGATLRVRSQYWTIQGAIDAASNGDTIIVENGLYQLTEPIDFKGKAIIVISENGYTNCTIDGQWPGFIYPDPGGWSCVVFNNGEGNDSVLSGFQIISGTNGGINIDSSAPTIENCWIRRNANRNGGGGIYSVFGSPVIKSCIISMNTAYTLTGTVSGGGLAFFGGNPTLINCAIDNNRAENLKGGGIYCSSANLTIFNSSIVNNHGFWSSGGGGIHIEGGSTVTITNSILWQNNVSQISESDSNTVNITYSDIEEIWPGTGNINSNPNFISGSYQVLGDSSPCIDAGTDVGAPVTDINGRARPQDAGFDMGVFEYCSKVRFYKDDDGDGFGDPDSFVEDCAQPAGYVNNDSDCNDDDDTIKPGVAESCDGIDENCDGEIDDTFPRQPFYQDQDGDSYGNDSISVQACIAPIGYVTDNTDCNDALSAVNPASAEVCNFTDDDCDGSVDEGLPLFTYYLDLDGDSYGDINDSLQRCALPTGYVSDNTDCNDSVTAVNPGMPEICNFFDDDCDGSIDEGVGAQTYYQDLDGDSYGDPYISTTVCIQPAGYVDDNDDLCPNDAEKTEPGACGCGFAEGVCFEEIGSACFISTLSP